LVVLDETNGLNTEDIENLSAIRDRGIAERTIVGATRKTSARVRLIWISNPRGKNRRIENYTSGIQAIGELIGRAEDISRFDFAVIVTSQDVSNARINVITHPHVEHKYTSFLCNKLLMWAWSRKHDQVIFDKGVEKIIMDYAKEMGAKYSESIPLVQGSVQRTKIAKLAVALACRLFSTTDGNRVIVKAEHVETIVKFLYDTYDSKYFGYGDYSLFQKEENQLGEWDYIKKLITKMENPQQFINKVLNSDTILFEDLMDFANYSRDQTKTLKQSLVATNCIKRHKSYYIKTPEFITFLKKLIENIKEKVPF